MSIVRSEHHDGEVPHGFRILSQEHREIPQPDGRMEGQWTIHFETPSGVHSFIKILDRFYTPENIAREIHHKVREIETVHQLGQHPEA